MGVLDAAHIVTAVVTSPPERRPVGAVTVSLLLNAALIALLVWIARGVRRGQRFGAACVVLLLLLFSMLVIVALVATGGSYHGSPILGGVQVLFALGILTSVVLVLRASVRGEPEEGHAP